MIRFVLALTVCIALSPPATATITPYKEFARREARGSRPFAPLLPVRAEDRAYQIGNETEVRLDGRKCRYQDVPNTAEIL